MPENETHIEPTEDISHLITTEELLEQHPHTSPVPVLPQLSVALGLLVFVFGVTYIGINSTNTFTKENTTTSEVRVEAMVPSEDKKIIPIGNIFEDTRIEAQSAFVWDVEKQRILFNKNGDDQLPLASITKLMTALVAYELLEPEDTVAITSRALQAEGDSGLSVGEEFTVENLMDLVLIASSNDGASALGASVGDTILPQENAEAVFVTAMNVRAQELGLTNTYFENSTGLDLSVSKAGAYGSARDVALLMEYIITNAADAVIGTTDALTRVKNESGAYHTAQNTNDYVNDMPGLIASKTGYTTLSGGNLVVAVDAGLNRPVIVVVLGSSFDGRFRDTLELLKRAELYIAHESE